MHNPTARSPSKPQEEDKVPHPISHMLKNENRKQSTGTTLLAEDGAVMEIIG